LEEEVFMMSLVGKPAPDFELEGYFNGQFSRYKLSDYRKKWVLLLFYPLDFTFVCPTEVLNFSSAAEKFTKLDCQIFGISVDSVYVHKAWVDTKREDGGLGGSLNYPLLSDLNKVTARDYGILMEDEGVALRGLFLINPDGVIMHSTINSLSVGRSVTEAMRVMKAFQFVSSHEGQVCPADWEDGKDTMVANSDGMKDYLTSH
jgi:peroxiredoxin (alkyl hydroperoxide reductase subunit C)